jgi:hypothetical protein
MRVLKTSELTKTEDLRGITVRNTERRFAVKRSDFLKSTRAANALRNAT